MLTSQEINYEIGGNVEATAYGGIFAMHRLVTRLGLVRAIDAALNLLKIYLPYHESDHVLTLAYSVLTGGTRLEDVDRLRNDVPLMNGLGAKLLPDPTTTGDFLRRFTEADIVALMDAINSVRPVLWRGRRADLLGEVVYLDADGTIVPTTGELKQGMDISYKGIWGYAPLLITLANTREVLYLVNRPGNAPGHLDAAAWIDRAIALVHPYAKRVCVRGDTDFSLTINFDRWAEQVLGALRAPVDALLSNWAYMLIAALAWNIKSWHAMMMHRNHDRHAFIRMEFKRFLDTVSASPSWSSSGPAPSSCVWSPTPSTWTGSSAPGPPPNAPASATAESTLAAPSQHRRPPRRRPRTPKHRNPTTKTRSKRTRGPPSTFPPEPTTLGDNPHRDHPQASTPAGARQSPNLAYLRASAARRRRSPFAPVPRPRRLTLAA
jgi:hypothetical protein